MSIALDQRLHSNVCTSKVKVALTNINLKARSGLPARVFQVETFNLEISSLRWTRVHKDPSNREYFVDNQYFVVANLI